MKNKFIIFFIIGIFFISLASAVIVKDTNTNQMIDDDPWSQSFMGAYIEVTANANISLMSYNVSSLDTASETCYAWESGGIMARGTFSLVTHNCSFTAPYPTFRNGSQVFLFLAKNDNATTGGNYGADYSATLPVVGTNIKFLSASYMGVSQSPINNTAQIYEIDSVFTDTIATSTTPTLDVNLSYPVNTSLITTTSSLFKANYTTTYMNVSNATYYIWYSNHTLFNKSNLSVNLNENWSSLNVSGFLLGAYNWNIYACGTNTTATICSWGNKGNFSFDVGGSLLAENYSPLSYETFSEKFQANFSMFPGTNLISAYLIYNNTPYVVSDITNYGTIIELKRTIDLPLNGNNFINDTKQFYWSFIFSNGGLISQNTSTKNQTVMPLNIVHCNSTYSINSLNFTTYDETNPNPKINATFHTFWNFWGGSGTIKKNYSWEDTSLGNSSFKFCIVPNQSTIHVDLNSEITSTGFFPRTYYLNNATINNITQEVPLRLINDSLGVKFFHTIRQGVTRISNAIVIISKFDVGLGVWVTVGIRESDDTGQFIEYLELDKEYTYSITQNGVFLGNLVKTATCSATPCMMNLDVDRGAINLWNGYYDAFAPNVVSNLTYNKTSHNVTYTFVDTSGLATYFRLQVNKISTNQTGELLCDKTIYATVGTLTCDLTGETGQFVAKAYVSRSPEMLIKVLYGILDALADAIGKDEGLLFSLILVVTVGLIGAFNPVAGVILAGIAFIFAGLMGFIVISMTSIILVILLIIILVVKMGKQGV